MAQEPFPRFEFGSLVDGNNRQASRHSCALDEGTRLGMTKAAAQERPCLTNNQVRGDQGLGVVLPKLSCLSEMSITPELQRDPE